MRLLAAVLIFIFSIHEPLEAQSTFNSWRTVEQLTLGQPIVIFERGQGHPTFCRIDLTTDTTLTCILTYGSPIQRLVFPVTNIAAIAVQEPAKPSRVGKVINAIGGGLIVGGIAGYLAGRTGLLVGVPLGALGGWILGDDSDNIPSPLHPRVIYRAPQPAP